MKKILLCAAMLGLVGCQTTSSIPATKTTDRTMSCDAIAEEITEMNELIGSIGSYENQALATNVGTSIGGHALGMSGVPFLGAAIGHAGGLANMKAAERQEYKREAEMRLNTLNGLYMGKGCTA